MSGISLGGHTSAVPSTSFGKKTSGVLVVPKRKVIMKAQYEFQSTTNLRVRTYNTYFSVINIWRVLMLILPSLIFFNKVLYSNIISQKILEILSIPLYIIPAVTIDSSLMSLSISYFIINVITIIFHVSFSLYYLRYDKISTTIVKLCHFWVQGPFIIIQHAFILNIGTQICKVCYTSNRFDYPPIYLSTALTLLSYFIFSFFYQNVTSIGLIWVNTSFLSYIPQNNSMIFHFTSCICLLSGIANILTDVPLYCIFSAMIVTYIICAVMLYVFNAFIRPHWWNALMSGSVTGVIILVHNFIITILKIQPIFVLYPIELIIFSLSYFIFNLVYKKRKLATLVKLDEVLMSHDAFDNNFTSLLDMINGAFMAFSTGHPVIINWKYISIAIERWPYSSYLWIVWSRFVSCYPNDARLMKWVMEQMSRSVKHTYAIQNIKSQMYHLSKYRENRISPVIRKRLGDCEKLVSTAQNRLLNFWKCVLQGNAHLVELSALDALDAWRKARNEHERLIESYPNSHLCVRSYSRFLLQTMAPQYIIDQWQKRYKEMKSGRDGIRDAAQHAAIVQFPNMMIHIHKKMYHNHEIGSSILTEAPSLESAENSSILDESPDSGEMATTHNNAYEAIHAAVTKMKTPTITCSIVLNILFAILIFGILIPAFGSIIITQSDGFVTLSRIASKLSHIENIMTYGPLLAQMHHAIVIGSDRELSFEGEMTTCEVIKAHMDDLMNKSEECISSLKSKLNFLDQYVNLSTVHHMIYNGVRELVTYEGTKTNPMKVTTTPSVEDSIVSTTIMMHELLNTNDYDSALKVIDEKHTIYNILETRYHATVTIQEALEELLNVAYSDLHRTEDIISYVKISLYIVCAGFNIVMLIALIIKTYKDKKDTAKCYLMLPKHIVEDIVNRLNLQKKASFPSNRILTNTTTTPSSCSSNSSTFKNNKQENEGIVMTLSISNSFNFRYVFPILFLVIFTGVSFGCSGLVISIYFDQGIEEICTMIDFACYAYAITHVHSLAASAMGELYAIGLKSDGFDVAFVDIKERANIASEMNLNMSKSIFTLFFGTKNEIMQSMTKLDDTFMRKSMLMDPDDFINSSNLHDTIENISPFGRYLWLMRMIPIQIMMMNRTFSNIPNGTFGLMAHVVGNHLYDDFVKEYASTIPNIAAGKHSDVTSNIIAFMVFFCALGLTATGLSVSAILQIRKQQINLLNWLDTCPTESILQSDYIVSMLSGDMKKYKKEVTRFTDKYFNNLINITNEIAIVTTDPNLNIVSANDAVKSIMPQMEVGKNVLAVLHGNEGILREIDNAMLGHSAFNFTKMVRFDDRHISITVMARTKRGYFETTINNITKPSMFVFVGIDRTEDVLSSMLWEEEREKLHNLLVQILPLPIVHPYETNEKVTFTANNASIVLISLLDLQRAMSSLSPMQTMSVFNMVISRLDSQLPNYPSLCRIRTSSSYYGVLGGGMKNGIPPDIHAKEAVKYAIDVLKEIRRLEPSVGFLPPVKIAVNMGGPVVGGVYTLGRPMFDVFGYLPSISIELVHRVNPMTVTITRHVYESIYGLAFNIKELGEIKINGRQTCLYSVTDRPI